MAERRTRARYEIPQAGVAWTRWTAWRWFTGARIRSKTRCPQMIDTLADIAPGGIAFTTAQPPKEGSRVLLNVFLPGEPQALIARGLVASVRRDQQGETSRVAVKFDRPLSESWAAKFRVLGSGPDREQSSEADDAP